MTKSCVECGNDALPDDAYYCNLCGERQPSPLGDLFADPEDLRRVQNWDGSVSLAGVDLSNADLHDANLEGANLERAVLPVQDCSGQI